MSNSTISLTGSEVRADFYGTNAWIRNDGEKTIYASKNADISAGADGVVSIPAGGSAPVYDAQGTVYIKGSGSVQLIGSNYAVNPFKTSAQSGGSGADEVARAAISAHAGNSAIHLTSEQLDSAVAGANAYADGKDGETLAAAQTYADSAAENAVSTANAYTDEQLSEAVSAHNMDENAHAGRFAAANHTHNPSDIDGLPSVSAGDEAGLRKISAGTEDLTAGTSELATGEIYLVYE